eukprot:4175167-Amphidinium_carterae.1
MFQLTAACLCVWGFLWSLIDVQQEAAPETAARRSARQTTTSSTDVPVLSIDSQVMLHDAQSREVTNSLDDPESTKDGKRKVHI